ncbi:glycoside hydrolase family 104 protein [bacterium]|nr:glycoside hydrolase family 104 protein [bacterium]
MIKEVTVEVLGEIFKTSKSQIASINISLGANEKSSTVSIDILDPDFKFADKLFKYSRSKKGIRLPSEFFPEPTKANTVTPSTPTPGVNQPATPTNNAGKLEGLESLPHSFSAFLTCIGWAENKGYNKGDLVYNIIFGGGTFNSYSDHPRRLFCSGGLCSDAAGAFQFLSTSWDDIRGRYRSQLPDYSPKYQNLGTSLVIKTYNSRSDDAYNRIIRGTDQDIIKAAKGLAWFWASLPGSPYGQPTVNDSQFMTKYKQVMAKWGNHIR